MRDSRDPRLPSTREPAFEDEIRHGDTGPWRPRPPVRGDGDGDGSGRFEADRGLIRIAGIIGILAVVILILVLPPISILDSGDSGNGDTSSGGVDTKARKSLPQLPEGLEAASALYDIEGGAVGIPGPATLTVRLSQVTNDGRNLAFYTYVDGRWERLGPVEPADGGRAARGEVAIIPSNIAVLRRLTFARTPGLILAPDQELDPAAPIGGIVSVLGAIPAGGGEDVDLAPGLIGGLAERYLGVMTATAAHAASVNRILADPAATRRHVDAIVAAAQRSNASGVHLDYAAVDPARRAAFTSLVEQLASQLSATRRGLVVTVATPTSANDTGGYDWTPLAGAADALWLRGPSDPALFYELLEPALTAKRDSGFDLRKVSLVLDRRSHDQSPEGVTPISQHEALAKAAELQTRLDQSIVPGRDVTLIATNLAEEEGDSGLRWSDRAFSVFFSFTERSNKHTIWVENRFSAAFRLDLARRYGLGGATVDGAGRNDSLPDIWNVVNQYLEEGSVRLELPFGPYLQPQWSASDGNIDQGASNGLAIWNAPARTGVYDITLVASDGHIFVGRQLQLRVAEAQREPTPIPTASPSPTATRAATPAATATPRATPRATGTATSN